MSEDVLVDEKREGKNERNKNIQSAVA